MFNRSTDSSDPLDAIEAPSWWFLIGQVVSLVVITILAKLTFDIPYWIGGLALVMSFILALVACRVTGETDTTPVGAMGQITQLTVGALNPRKRHDNANERQHRLQRCHLLSRPAHRPQERPICSERTRASSSLLSSREFSWEQS